MSGWGDVWTVGVGKVIGDVIGGGGRREELGRSDGGGNICFKEGKMGKDPESVSMGGSIKIRATKFGGE